jgi:hypothetical protein
MRQFTKALRVTGTAVGLSILGSIMIASSPALAEVLQFSALGLERQCPCGMGDEVDDAEESNGVLKPKNVAMRYFMPVALPHGQNVCRFSMVYHDINAGNSMTARLKRKVVVAGDPPFDPPTTMASVISAAGTPDTIRKANDTTITSPLISTTNSFYYIELEVPTVNLNPIGFQIDVRPTCP